MFVFFLLHPEEGEGCDQPGRVAGHELELLPVQVLQKGGGEDGCGGLRPLPPHQPQQLARGQRLQLVVDRGAEVLVDVGVVVPA